MGMIGLLQLDTRFPRPIGDVGHPASWASPLLIERMVGLTVPMIVHNQALTAPVIAQIITHAHTLCARGATVIVGSCGFLAAHHADIAPKVHVPTFSSSLLAITQLQRENVPSAQIGVLTFNADALSPRHFAGVGAAMPTAIVGLDPASYLRRVISANETRLDLAQAQAEVCAAARTLIARWPDVRVIVLECTNLGVYKRAIAAHTGCRVLDIVDVVTQATAA